MVLHRPSSSESRPLRLEEVAVPSPKDDEVLVRVDVCGVCRTDLHVVEGDLPPRLASVIPGHEVVGRVVEAGGSVRTFSVGDPVGIPWLHHTCGRCEYCRTSRENLCEEKVETGYGVNGGYAEFAVAEEAYALRLPASDPAPLAPLMCAGLIGYRALKLALPRPGGRIGFFGFGGSAHLTLQLAARLGYETVAFSRNPAHLALAERLGASETVLTAGEGASPRPPHLDGAVVFAPVGESVLQALRELRKGATVSIAAIHMTPLPPIDYDRDLFGERKIVSVEANTRADAREFLDLAAHLKLESTVSVRGLASANEALIDLKHGDVVGAVVLDCR
ncbi:MAG TPA: zinc-binding alcohol dehydrogenase family protein [Thermoplasmata archaeon]|nr:zinc-binding alcohol dehydrogenase family protein [Thermoplasmata archaeon]